MTCSPRPRSVSTSWRGAVASFFYILARHGPTGAFSGLRSGMAGNLRNAALRMPSSEATPTGIWMPKKKTRRVAARTARRGSARSLWGCANALDNARRRLERGDTRARQSLWPRDRSPCEASQKSPRISVATSQHLDDLWPVPALENSGRTFATTDRREMPVQHSGVSQPVWTTGLRLHCNRIGTKALTIFEKPCPRTEVIVDLRDTRPGPTLSISDDGWGYPRTRSFRRLGAAAICKKGLNSFDGTLTLQSLAQGGNPDSPPPYR